MGFFVALDFVAPGAYFDQSKSLFVDPKTVADPRRERVRREDAVKHLWHFASEGRAATLASLAGSIGVSRWRSMRLVQKLESLGLVRSEGEVVSLTAEGERLALRVVRAHRLWETFLAREAAMPLGRVHGEAERAEHRLSADEVESLADLLGHPGTDPHGDPIPTAGGDVPPSTGTALSNWPIGKVGRVVHVEDEPAAAFGQLVAMGLRPGREVRVIERDAERLVASDGEDELRLSPVLAGCVFVVEAGRKPAERTTRLDRWPMGLSARVARLDETLQGIGRRRLLDLGVTPGTTITPILRGMFGGSRAYRVRGTTVALRSEQAAEVWVTPAAVAG